METLTSIPINITESALYQLRRIQQEQEIPSDHGLRVGIKGGGCSGFSYVLGFDTQKDNDQVYELGGLKILMEKAHSLYLAGMEIEWIEGLNNRGFSFINPNAKSTCGCGSSFSA